VSTITDGITAVTPLLVIAWDTQREAGNVLHDIIGRTDDDVTLRPARLRTGTLECLCATLEDALQLEILASLPVKLIFEDADHPALNMTFVASGAIAVALDDETRRQATCSIDFAQVAP
jgi:hypothetical protein